MYGKLRELLWKRKMEVKQENRKSQTTETQRHGDDSRNSMSKGRKGILKKPKSGL